MGLRFFHAFLDNSICGPKAVGGQGCGVLSEDSRARRQVRWVVMVEFLISFEDISEELQVYFHTEAIYYRGLSVLLSHASRVAKPKPESDRSDPFRMNIGSGPLP